MCAEKLNSHDSTPGKKGAVLRKLGRGLAGIFAGEGRVLGLDEPVTTRSPMSTREPISTRDPTRRGKEPISTSNPMQRGSEPRSTSDPMSGDNEPMSTR